ncbi:MAG: dihydroorotase [Erysipelotrichales bacterium]|nr:dihydroorotase [Erysipelotrichales bacterium]
MMTKYMSNSMSNTNVNELLSNSDLSFLASDRFAIIPGFCDVHVHFREPGFSYKETIKTGTASAARGGYTAVCTMPNLNPVPDTAESLQQQLDIIERDASISVYPYAAITVGQMGEQLADLEAMAPNCIAFSDDGRVVQSDDMMREAMLKAKSLGKMIVAHCEVNSLLKGGYIHEGEYAKAHGHRGICSESEYAQVARDIELVRETGCDYHVCHISAKETVELIRQAKKEGLPVTCETGPHYLVLDDSDLQEEGRFKMNPPLRGKEDKEALLQGIIDGTIDMIATDHAPHSEEEKSKGLEGSSFGIVGLETAFPLLYTKLVKTGVITMERLIELMVTNPRNRFHIPMTNDYSIWDLEQEFTVDPNEFLTKGRATPFTGEKLFGVNYLTVKEGNIVYQHSLIKGGN